VAPGPAGKAVDSPGMPAIVRLLSAQSAPLMYAVIRTGGKQYKVAKDDLITVEKLAGAPGATVTLADVLLVGDGADANPRPSGAQVTAEVVKQIKGEKVLIFKKRRRHNYRRKNGHRQQLTVLRVTGISAGR
jgi:large subunit ribosomal protein L21